jgi:hypothetical protein
MLLDLPALVVRHMSFGYSQADERPIQPAQLSRAAFVLNIGIRWYGNEAEVSVLGAARLANGAAFAGA